MEHLLENWEEAKELFVDPLFLISDYDGTLAPIEDTPEEAEVSENVKKYLARLTDLCPVGIISGRSLDDLKPRIDIPNVYYSGNHGYEISGPDIDFVKAEAERARPAIREICDLVRDKSKNIEGSLIEDKGVTASIHYRLVDEAEVSKLKKIFRDIIEPYRDEGIIEINHGKEVLEIRPAGEWDKGEAVTLLHRITGFEEETLPVYLGDDVTDEDAFFALEQTGLGVLVSDLERESAADFRLNGVGEVELFLKSLTEFLERF